MGTTYDYLLFTLGCRIVVVVFTFLFLLFVLVLVPGTLAITPLLLVAFLLTIVNSKATVGVTVLTFQPVRAILAGDRRLTPLASLIFQATHTTIVLH